MEGRILLLLALAVFLILFVTAALRNRAEWLLNMIMRAVLGMIAIYFINAFLSRQGIEMCVGINVITFLTSGILGFPGLAVLYGLGFYNLL